MIIRCPHCDHTRTINTDKIPPSAELATCPRCKNRFRFRALEKADAPVFDSAKDKDPGQSSRGFRENGGKRADSRQMPPPASLKPSGQEGASPSSQNIPPILIPPEEPHSSYAMQEVQRPQSAFREAAEKAGTDLWDAVDVLHRRWENQLDQHVTEVVTPRPTGAMAAQQEESFRNDLQPLMRRAPLDENRQRATRQNRTSEETAGAFPAMSDLYDSMTEEEENSLEKDQLSHMQNIAARTLVNYSEQGSSPEDIVEQDIKILQQSHAEQRPMRDLGKLNTIRDPRETPAEDNESQDSETQVKSTPFFATAPQPAPIPTPAAPEPFNHSPPQKEDLPEDRLEEEEESQVPWENPEEFGGWFKALLNTIYLVMLRGPSFYSNLGRAGAPLKHCYLFFLILGYVAIIGSVLWAEITMLIIQDAAPLVDNLLTLPVLLITAPLLLGLMQLFVTGCMRLQLKLLAPERSDFATSFRITAYSVAPFVMCLVPFVGPSIAAAWFAFALTTGCRYALRLSWVYSVAVTLPPAGLLIGGLCWFFLT